MAKTDWKVYLKAKVDGSILDDLKFPQMCPRCLGKTDLTSYTTKWRKEGVKVPICKSCKKAAIWKMRKEMAIIAAVWVPVCWALLLLPGTRSLLGKIADALGFPWGLLPPLVLAGTPLYALYLLITSFLPSTEAGWPVCLEEPGLILAVENEAYVKKFMTINTEKLTGVVDWAASPPKWLMKDGHILM